MPTLKEHLSIAISIILVGGVCLGWVGGKAVDYTFDHVRENTEFRVGRTESLKHEREVMKRLERTMNDLSQQMKIYGEATIRTEERLKQWEPAR